MSHDGDKLIRQLSLVAYLMAARRPVTARDAKGAVEGYADMSDEAFARRFYADRAELQTLGIPLPSQRDEFTGEELYSLPAEQYFLPPLHLTDAELAALQTCLYLLEGQFAYAEPLRLALQNLALGRPNPTSDASQAALSLNLSGGGYSAEIAQRLAKLEGAISKQRTVVFPYFAMSREEEATRTVDPYSLFFEHSQWYLVGRDHDREDLRVFRVSRIRGDIRFATRRERDFRLPEDFDPEPHREQIRAPWQLGEQVGEATVHVAPAAAWLVERLWGTHGTVTVDEDDRSAVFVTPYAHLGQLVQWIIGMDGEVLPLAPADVVDEVVASLERGRDVHVGPAPDVHPTGRIVPEDPPPSTRRASPVAPERFAVLQALLADLLEACGDEPRGEVAVSELAERYHLGHETLVDQINLLNLVNFGGGCYAVYAEIDGDTVRVEKELYGDEFRRPARLSPLEAKAILMALDLAGPQVAAGAGTSLATVRQKVEAAFGGFDLKETPVPSVLEGEEDILTTLNRGLRERLLVRISYLSRSGTSYTEREIEPYLLRGVGSSWYVETWDRTNNGERTFRVDRINSAELGEPFEPRENLSVADPERLVVGRSGTASVLFSSAVAQRETEDLHDFTEVAGGGAVVQKTYGSERWLITEVLKHRGDALVLAPEALREGVVARADELLAAVRSIPAAHPG